MRVILMARAAWAAVLFAAIALSAAAQPERIVERGGVAYVSGGIGEDSQERLRAREAEFNLKLVFTLLEGNYLADVGVVIKDAAGRTVVEHVAEGPIFLARLSAGRYAVSATYEGRTVNRDLQVGVARLRTEYLRWPSNPATDVAVSRWSRE